MNFSVLSLDLPCQSVACQLYNGAAVLAVLARWTQLLRKERVKSLKSLFSATLCLSYLELTNLLDWMAPYWICQSEWLLDVMFICHHMPSFFCSSLGLLHMDDGHLQACSATSQASHKWRCVPSDPSRFCTLWSQRYRHWLLVCRALWIWQSTSPSQTWVYTTFWRPQ